MILSLVLGIILGAMLVVFALQNVAVVTLTFFAWQFQGSLALVVILAAALGVFVALLVVLPESISSYFNYRRLRKTNARLEEDLIRQRELNATVRNAPEYADGVTPVGHERTI